MHYLVDGYNFMFRVAYDEEDLQKQREKIIHSLNLKMGFLGLKATLVFDAQYQPEGIQRSYYDALEIVYTSRGETADDCILNFVKESATPSRFTIVTSDKKLARLAERLGAKVDSSEHFNSWLTKRFYKKAHSKKEPVQKKEPLVVLKKKKPSLKALPEDCFQYYLEMFEQEVLPSPPAKKEGLVKKEKKEKPLSDMERWLRAFEE